jgi:hypothetical protein
LVKLDSLLGASNFFALIVTAAIASYWRTLEGHHPLPELFTLVQVPASVGVFVLLDHCARYSWPPWIAVGAPVSTHMLLSVPAFPEAAISRAAMASEQARRA